MHAAQQAQRRWCGYTKDKKERVSAWFKGNSTDRDRTLLYVAAKLPNPYARTLDHAHLRHARPALAVAATLSAVRRGHPAWRQATRSRALAPVPLSCSCRAQLSSGARSSGLSHGDTSSGDQISHFQFVGRRGRRTKVDESKY